MAQPKKGSALTVAQLRARYLNWLEIMGALSASGREGSRRRGYRRCPQGINATVDLIGEH